MTCKNKTCIILTLPTSLVCMFFYCSMPSSPSFLDKCIVSAIFGTSNPTSTSFNKFKTCTINVYCDLCPASCFYLFSRHEVRILKTFDSRGTINYYVRRKVKSHFVGPGDLIHIIKHAKHIITEIFD